jgi:hypothetical protein
MFFFCSQNVTSQAFDSTTTWPQRPALQGTMRHSTNIDSNYSSSLVRFFVSPWDPKESSEHVPPFLQIEGAQGCCRSARAMDFAEVPSLASRILSIKGSRALFLATIIATGCAREGTSNLTTFRRQ